MSPSPSVFLSAVIQRTRRLRIGPLVYLLPLYHPLRLIEEVCMLDNLSGGRMQVSVGRGISPIELGYYGRTPDEAREIYEENLRILRGCSRALSQAQALILVQFGILQRAPGSGDRMQFVQLKRREVIGFLAGAATNVANCSAGQQSAIR
jgi:alkanesulfonate monooxygenase SsuD/methylene tetrahydromethanopterin reductase-like flavin-dependent oxidoreductase (luciferase family)